MSLSCPLVLIELMEEPIFTIASLTNPHRHKYTIKTANGQLCYTEARGKYKVQNSKTPIYKAALSVPSFTLDLISVGQLAKTHDVVFNKEICYLRGQTPRLLTQLFLEFGDRTIYTTPQHATRATTTNVNCKKNHKKVRQHRQ